MKSAKKLLAMLLAVIMLFSVMSVGMSVLAMEVNVGNNAGDEVDRAETTDKVIICVPETIYLKPSTTLSNTVEFFVNNIVDENGDVSLEAKAANSVGFFSIYAPDATSFSFEANGVGGYGDPVIGSTILSGTLEGSEYGLTDGYLYYPYLNCTINGSGLPATGTGLIEWKVTVNFADGTKGTYCAYTAVYSPFYHAVGSVDEVRQSQKESFNQISTWISGLTGASTQEARVGSYGVNDAGRGTKKSGTFMNEPIINLSVVTKSSVGNISDTIDESGPAYVRGMELSGNTSTSARGSVGYMTIDGSRYSNANQIPNFYIGADLNEAGSESATLRLFYSWYVVGTADGNGHVTEDKVDSEPSGWNKWIDIDSSDYSVSAGVITNTSGIGDTSDLRSFVRSNSNGARFYMRPSVDVADIAAKGESVDQYIHVMAQSRLHAPVDIAQTTKYYGNSYASVKFTVTDKSDLRAAVLQATSLDESKYTTSSWRGDAVAVEEFQEALRDAAEVLGNPAASQGSIDSAVAVLREKMNSLKVTIKFDAATNGGVFTDGEEVKDYSVVFGTNNSITLKSGILNYFPVAKAGYEFIGWSLDPNDPASASLSSVGVTYGDILYAHYAKTISVNFHSLTDVKGNTSFNTSSLTIYNNDKNAVDVEVLDAESVGDYIFAGWTADPSSTEGESMNNLTINDESENADYYATYKKNVSVMLDVNGGDSYQASVSGDIFYNYNLSETTGVAEITLPEIEPTRAGHGFDGWDINGTIYQAGDTVELDQSTTATAVWGIEKYDVTFNYKDAVGNDASVTVEIEYGKAATAPKVSDFYADSNMHYEFSGWDVAFDFITGDTTVTAQYKNGVMHNYTTTGTPDCEKDVDVVYTCSACGYHYTITFEAGHNYVVTDSKDADCENDGYKVYICQRDASHTYTEIIKASGHSFENTVYVAPTCTEDGHYISGTCSKCNENLAGKVIPALGHSWTVETEATCEHPGLKVCSGWTDENGVHHDCDVTEVIPQLPHDYTSVVTAPTCEEDGKVVYTCSDCGHTYETVIPATGHIYATIIIAPSCTSQGYTIKTCPNCGDSERMDYVPALGHSYVSVVVAPTCTAQGYTKHTCSVCNYSYKSDYVDALGHDYSIETVVAPTCTKRGYTLHECSQCDSSYKTDYVDATGHDYVYSKTVQPSGTLNGYDLYICSQCGDEYKETIYADGKALICYTIYDDDGDVVPGATVVLTNVETGEQITITADKNGYFTYILPEGEYTVKVSGMGYGDIEGELFVESGAYTMNLPEMPCNDCSCLCHADSFFGKIYRLIIQMFSIFGKIYCCDDCEVWK